MLKKLQKRLKDNKGFSLVELIVVIAIMVILIALLVPNVSGYIGRARRTADLTNAQAVYSFAVNYVAEQAMAGADISAISHDTLRNAVEEALPNINAGDYTATDITNGTVKSVTYNGIIYPDDATAEESTT